MLIWVLALSAGALIYVFLLYPLLLLALVRLRGPRPVVKGSATPRVSLVISAYNEAESIAQKIENSLSLDYPRDLLEIAIVSDASDDGTDAIVRSFADRGVRLFRQDERRGKTAGLNRVVPEVSGEIVVFSDANAMYQPDAIRMLVRNFADTAVGCVTGEARYLSGGRSAASVAERLYWRYEMALKRLETAVGSVVGGDGAIYAIRRALWRTLPDDAINDFLNPLQIVGAGWRGVYEPEAVCYEETAGNARREYKRRVRIVSRSWRAVFQAEGVLNPLRVGFFAFSLLSHKVLRWMTGVFLVTAAASMVVLGWQEVQAVRVLLTAMAVVVGLLVLVSARARRMAALPVYYLIVSTASIVGIAKGSFGRVSGVWTTPRGDAPSAPAAAHPFIARSGAVVLILVTLATLAALAVVIVSATMKISPTDLPARIVFWSAVGVLAYVYAGYPLLLAAVRPLFRRPVVKADIEPNVCLFVAANDESEIIAAKIRNSLSVDYPPSRLSIVIASDGSVDGTNEIVRSYEGQGVRLLAFPERRGKMSTINDGVTRVDDEIIVFSDANTFLQPGAVRALVRSFADDHVGAVSGDVILTGDRASLARSEDLYYRYERWLQRAESDIGSMLGVDGALYAIRRPLFLAPPGDTILDDMAIPMSVVRAGYRVVFEPDAIAFEHGSQTASEEFIRKVRVAAGAVQFLLRPESAIPKGNVQLLAALVSHKTLRWMSPIFAGLAFVAALALASHSALFVWAAVLEAASVFIALLGCLAPLRRFGVVGLAHYFWLVQTAAIVGFTKGLLGRQAVAWRRFSRQVVPAGVSRI